MNFNQLKTDLKNSKMAPIYLILGEQTYLADQIKNLFINSIPEEERSMNVGSYDMEDTTIGEALNDANSISFFGDKRLVMINRPYFLTGNHPKNKLDQSIDNFMAYLKQPQETTTMVIFAPYSKLDARKKVTKLLNQVAEVVEINKLNENQIKAVVVQELNEKQYEITNEAMDALLQATNFDLTEIMNALTNLFLYHATDKKINLLSVDRLVSRSMEQNVFELVNLVLEKNVSKALQVYQELLANKEDPLKVNAVLIQQFRLLMQVMILSSHGYSQGTLASSLKVHPYRIKLALQSIKNLDYEDLKNGYLGLVQIEENLKSTQRSPEILFELFLFKFNVQKNTR